MVNQLASKTKIMSVEYLPVRVDVNSGKGEGMKTASSPKMGVAEQGSNGWFFTSMLGVTPPNVTGMFWAGCGHRREKEMG